MKNSEQANTLERRRGHGVKRFLTVAGRSGNTLTIDRYLYRAVRRVPMKMDDTGLNSCRAPLHSRDVCLHSFQNTLHQGYIIKHVRRFIWETTSSLSENTLLDKSTATFFC